MKRIALLALALFLSTACFVGCGEKDTIKKETKITTPTGSTTTTTETEVKKTGDHKTDAPRP